MPFHYYATFLLMPLPLRAIDALLRQLMHYFLAPFRHY